MEHGTHGTGTRNNKGSGGSGKSRTFGPCTWNNWSENDLEYLETTLRSECEEYYINKEVGENGTPHLQYCMRFKNPRSKCAVIKLFEGSHIEVSKNWNATKNYCCKKETSDGEGLAWKKEERSVKDPLDGKTPKPFQSDIIALMNEEPDDRTIHWYYDLNGNIGKTTLAKHLCIKYPGQVLYMGGKAADVKYGVFNFIKSGKDLKIVIFDYTRSTEQFVSYEAIEAVKNGIFYNTKYESEMCVFDSPHIVVFSNFEPEMGKLSLDRWNIVNLTEY